MNTGDLHNRVYGSGDLLLNLSCATTSECSEAEAAVHREVERGLAEFRELFSTSREFARTARDAAAITRLDWLKRGMPCLDNTDPWAEELLASSGAGRWPDDEPGFTCDAIWFSDQPGSFTAVLGPGRLDTHHAHAEGEFADRAELAEFATVISSVLIGFARNRTGEEQRDDPAA